VNAHKARRGLAGLALLGAGGLALAGCAAPPAEPTDAPEIDYLACAVSDEGDWFDRSFNQASYEGLLKAQDELGVQIKDAESKSIDDFQGNLTAMVDAGCDLTVAVGFNFSLNNVIFDFADANPDSQFLWVDGWNQGQTNLKPITYQMDQSSYLAGYLSAAYSTSKILATYGGGDFDAVTQFMYGFYWGAKAYEEETGTPITILGMSADGTDATSFTANFEDTTGAEAITAGFIQEGADVIFPVAGDLFTSTFKVIDESGRPDIVYLGVDKNISESSPEYSEYLLTSVEKRMTQAIFDVIKDLAVDGGTFAVDPYVGTLENGGTALSDFTVDVDPAISSKLEELTAGIIDGSITPIPGS
jgi:basic membrane protein A